MPTDLSVPRSVIQQILNVCLPLIVLFGGWLYWANITIRNKSSFKFLIKRYLLTAFVVFYVSYIALTTTAVRTFECIDIFDRETTIENYITNKYWESDTLVPCFVGSHLVLSLVLGIPLLLLSFFFPVGLTVFLIVTRNKDNLDSVDVQETVGLFFRGYEENLVFWDSVIMFRKAILVTTAVFAYNLGGTLQSLLATAVLLISLVLQIMLNPFKKDFGHLNELESASLCVSSFTFFSGIILHDPFMTSKHVEILITGMIFVANVILVSFLFFSLFLTWINQLKYGLLAEGLGSESMRIYSVIRLYIASQLQKIMELVTRFVCRCRSE